MDAARAQQVVEMLGRGELRSMKLDQRLALVEEAFAVLCAASPEGAVEVGSEAYSALQMVRAEYGEEWQKEIENRA